MPDSDRTAVGASADPGVPPELDAVVARWNPQGMALLTALRAPGSAGQVALVAPDDANTTLLRTELARFEPRIALTEPLTDVVGVETTLSAAPTPPAAALILLDAGSALGADALALIGRLRAAGTTILLAMNGIHAYADWRRVREHDLALLAAHGFGDLDILPVSARLAVAARTGDTALLDRSGLSALHAALTAATAAAEGDGRDRRAAVLSRVLTDTRRRITEQIEALRSDAETARWRAERATLLAARDGGRASATAALRGQLHLARVDLMTETGARVRTLHATARAEVDRLARGELTGYPRRLQQSVTDLTAGLDQDIDRRLAELAHGVDAAAAPVAPDASRAPAFAPGAHRAAELPPRRVDPAPRVGPDPEPRQAGVEDHLMVALGASAGAGLGRLLVSPLSLVPALDVASIPVTLALGALAAWWVVRARRQVADRAHLRQWVADALVNVKAQLEQRVATALVAAETALAERVMRESAQRIVDNDRRVAELEARIRRASAERPGQLAACERDIAVLDRHLPVAG
ncbi:hypothetical protein [Nocardia farcinica]